MARRTYALQPGPRAGELLPEQVYRVCDPAGFAFATTADLPALVEIIGQERAVTSVDFGVGIRSDGYNIYALGPTGTGQDHHRHQVPGTGGRRPAGSRRLGLRQQLQPAASSRTSSASRPAAPVSFAADMDKMIVDLQAAITLAFESEEYETHRSEIAQQSGRTSGDPAGRATRGGRKDGVRHGAHARGPRLRPQSAEGDTMSREQYNELPIEKQKEIDEGLEALNQQLQQVMREVRLEQKTAREALRELDRQVTTYAANT